MGYRAYVSKVNDEICLGKLYGYCDTYKLKSYQWLVDKGYIDTVDEEVTFAECNGSGDAVIPNWDFDEFIKLYNEDCNNYQGNYLKFEKDGIIKKKEIKDILENKNDACAYLIRWG